MYNHICPSRLQPRAYAEPLEPRRCLSATVIPVNLSEVVTQKDGSSLLVGNTVSGTVMLQRHQADGAIDTSFGTAGTLAVPAIGGLVGADADATGRLIVLTAKGLFRLLPNGQVDPTFAGAQGAGVTRLRGFFTYAVLVGPSGSIFVFGNVENKAHESFDAVAAFRSDGRISRGFGSAGLAIGAPSPTGSGGVYVDSRNRPVFADGDGAQPQIQRLTTEGVLDETFGHGGVVKFNDGLPNSRTNRFSDVAVSGDGELFAVTADEIWAGSGRAPTVVAAFHNDGTLVSHFGHGGSVTQVARRDTYSIFDCNVAVDGRGVLVSGLIARYSEPGECFVERLSSDGVTDKRYGSGDGIEVFPTSFDGQSARLPALAAATRPLDNGSRYIPLANITFDEGPSYVVRIDHQGKLDRVYGDNGYAAFDDSLAA